MKEIPPFISSDEKLITVGTFYKRAGYLKNQLTLGYAKFWNQFFYVGITNKRLVFLPIKRINGKVDKENVFSVDFDKVEVEKNKLIVETPDNGKFLKLSCRFGIKSLSGIDRNEFIDVLYQHKRS